MKFFLLRMLLVGSSLALVVGIFEIGLRLAGWEPIYPVYSKPSAMWAYP